MPVPDIEESIPMKPGSATFPLPGIHMDIVDEKDGSSELLIERDI